MLKDHLSQSWRCGSPQDRESTAFMHTRHITHAPSIFSCIFCASHGSLFLRKPACGGRFASDHVVCLLTCARRTRGSGTTRNGRASLEAQHGKGVRWGYHGTHQICRVFDAGKSCFYCARQNALSLFCYFASFPWLKYHRFVRSPPCSRCSAHPCLDCLRYGGASEGMRHMHCACLTNQKQTLNQVLKAGASGPKNLA